MPSMTSQRAPPGIADLLWTTATPCAVPATTASSAPPAAAASARFTMRVDRPAACIATESELMALFALRGVVLRPIDASGEWRFVVDTDTPDARALCEAKLVGPKWRGCNVVVEQDTTLLHLDGDASEEEIAALLSSLALSGFSVTAAGPTLVFSDALADDISDLVAEGVSVTVAGASRRLMFKTLQC